MSDNVTYIGEENLDKHQYTINKLYFQRAIDMNLTNLPSVSFNDIVNDTQVCYHLVFPKNLNLVKRSRVAPQIGGQNTSNKKRRRRGRPRKEEVKQFEEERDVVVEIANEEKSDENVVCLTRYGRVSRPPKHMSKFVDIKDTKVSAATDVNTIQAEIVSEIQTNFNVAQQTDAVQAAKTILEAKKIRKNVDRFTCGVCKKVENV